MEIILRVLSVLALVVMANATFADSLELADGQILEGDFVGSSNGIIMFNTGDSVEAYMEHQVVGIFLSEGVATAQTLSQTPASNVRTIPAGTKLVIRMAESIDARRHGAGYKFRGQLEGALVSGGVTVVPRGAILYGTVTSAKKGGRAFGKSELTMEFTDVMVNDQLYPIATEGLAARSGNEGGRTVGRTARAAAIGGLYGGSSSARKGAKVGLGASLLTSGSNLNVPAGTLLDTRLRMALAIN
ncbi:MAG: hypothetical protein HOC23_03725 [Halieaceae bacterium]|jgi:hypothetical protein|nr:hypothetical protein [Halieaceae bacterium]